MHSKFYLKLVFSVFICSTNAFASPAMLEREHVDADSAGEPNELALPWLNVYADLCTWNSIGKSCTDNGCKALGGGAKCSQKVSYEEVVDDSGKKTYKLIKLDECRCAIIPRTSFREESPGEFFE